MGNKYAHEHQAKYGNTLIDDRIGSVKLLYDQLVRYGVSAVTFLYIVSLYFAALQSPSPSHSQTNSDADTHLGQYQPECLYIHEEDYGGDHSETKSQPAVQAAIDTASLEPQTQAGEPISFTQRYQTAPLHDFYIKNRQFNAANIAFIDCTQEAESPVVQFESHGVTSTVELSIQQQAAVAETITTTVAQTNTNPYFSSTSETDMPLLGLPAEPRVHIFWDNDEQSNIMMLTNNVGIQFYRVEKIDKKIRLHKLTDYVPLSALVTEGCNIFGDVIPHIGPNGEIVIVSMDLTNQDENCVLYASSFSNAKNNGLSVFSVKWPGMKVADFPTPLFEQIDGKLYLVMTVNGLVTDRPNGKNGTQPMMMLEVQDGVLSGSLFVNQFTGSPLSLMTTSDSTGEKTVTGVSGYSNNSGSYLQSSELDAATQQMTYRPTIGQIVTPAQPANCKFNPQSQLVCIEQYGSTKDVIPSSMHLDKEIHVISMIDGSRQFIYQNLLTAANDPNTVHTNLFVARMLLNPDNTITQGMSKVYHLLDEAGRHINVTDCQTLLKPNGEMLITCVGLNAYEANSIIALEINSDGTVKTAQTVRKLKGAFIGSTIVRSGDYNGADSTAGEFNLAVFTHFVEFRSVVIFYAPDGEEIEVVEPQPVPTTTPEVPTPTSTPIVIVPIPTETIQPASNTVFLPLTRK